MATHFPDHALLVSTVVAILNQGWLAYQGAAEEVITEKNLRNTYGVNVKILYVGDGVDRKVCLFPSLQNTRTPLSAAGG
jgi:iron complex transport system ATP-binding protein